MNPIAGPACDWRKVLAEIDPRAATLSLSTHSAQLLASRGKHRAAAAAYRELLQRDPRNLRWLRSLAAILLQTGRHVEATECRRQAVKIELDNLQLPADELDAALEYLLAAEGLADQPSRAPANYMASHFDHYADRFDAHLVKKLQYRGPQVVFEAVAAARGVSPGGRDPSSPEKALLNVLDLGCGTGLAGPLMRTLARRLDGVDLSPGMIEKARAGKLYDHLVVGELIETLTHTDFEYDLLIAVDVLVYLGDLQPVFAASRRALIAGGMLAFTVESNPQSGYRLASTRRYIHHRDYVLQTAERAGLQTILVRETVLRHERGRPVDSLVCVLCRGTD